MTTLVLSGRVPIRLDDLPSSLRERSVDLGREPVELGVAREFGEALVHELASAIEVAALVSQLCLEEGQFGPAQSGVTGQLVQPVADVIVGQPLEEQTVPFGQVTRPLIAFEVPLPAGLIERVEVMVGESDPRVGYRELAGKNVGQGGLLLGSGAPSLSVSSRSGTPTG